jgi:hypothetical protein
MSPAHGRDSELGSEVPLPSAHAAHDSSDAVAAQPAQLSRYEPTGHEVFAHPASGPPVPLSTLVPELLPEPPPLLEPPDDAPSLPASVLVPIWVFCPEQATVVSHNAAGSARRQAFFTTVDCDAALMATGYDRRHPKLPQVALLPTSSSRSTARSSEKSSV